MLHCNSKIYQELFYLYLETLTFKGVFLYMIKSKKWTDQEKEILGKYFVILSQEELMKLLPNRSWDAIRTYACKGLELKRERKTLIRDNGKTRECKRCGKTFPQTEEYFYRDRKGFRSYCKTCWLILEEEKRKKQGALTHREKRAHFEQGEKYCGMCKKWKALDMFYATNRKEEMTLSDYHKWCAECEGTYISARGILKSNKAMRERGLSIKEIISVIQYIRTGNKETLERFQGRTDLMEIIGIVHQLIQSGSSGEVLISSRGDVCKSRGELEIAEFLIANNIKYIKDFSYENFCKGDKRSFDFLIIYKGRKIYIEYFGLYNSSKRRNYTQKANKKIEDLNRWGLASECIFLYTDMLEDGRVFQMIADKLQIEEVKYPDNLPSQLHYMSDAELLEIIMQYSEREGYLPTVSQMSNHHSVYFNEIKERYDSYTNFSQSVGVPLQYTQTNMLTLESIVDTIDCMIEGYGAFWGEDNIKKSNDDRLKIMLSAYKKFTVKSVKEYYLNYCLSIGSLTYAQGNYVSLEATSPVVEYMIQNYGRILSYHELKKINDKKLTCLKYAYRKYSKDAVMQAYNSYRENNLNVM